MKSLSVEEAVNKLKQEVQELEAFIEAIPDIIKSSDIIQSCIKATLCIHSVAYVTLRTKGKSIESIDMVSRMVENSSTSLKIVVLKEILTD